MELATNDSHGSAVRRQPLAVNDGPIRLRKIMTADFRKSEWTLLEEARAEAKNLSLGPHDALLLVSSGGTIIKFVFGFIGHEMVTADGRVIKGRLTRILPSRTYRILDGGTFNPRMLVNYAEEIGLSLSHLKRFEEYFRQEVTRRAR